MRIVEKLENDGLLLAAADFTAQEVSDAIDGQLAVMARRYSLCAKSPQEAQAQLEEQVGASGAAAMLADQVAESLSHYVVDRLGVIPAVPPSASAKGEVQRQRPLRISVRVLLKPSQELSSYDPVHVKVQPFTYDLEAAVEENLRSFAYQYPRYESLPPRPLAAGDTCMIAMKTRIDGKIVPEMTFEQRRYSLGCGLLPQEFDGKVEGMVPGEGRSVEFAVSTEAGEQALASAQVTLLEVQEVVYDEVDDAWVKKHVPVYKDLAGYKESIAETLDRMARRDYEQYLRGMAVATLAQRYSSSIPDEIYEAKAREVVSQLEQELAQAGTTMEAYIQHAGGPDSFNVNVMMEAREQLYQDYALDAYFAHEHLQVGESDIREACRALDPEDPSSVQGLCERAGRGYVLREAAQRYCAARRLLETALITVDAA